MKVLIALIMSVLTTIIVHADQDIPRLEVESGCSISEGEFSPPGLYYACTTNMPSAESVCVAVFRFNTNGTFNATDCFGHKYIAIDEGRLIVMIRVAAVNEYQRRARLALQTMNDLAELWMAMKRS